MPEISTENALAEAVAALVAQSPPPTAGHVRLWRVAATRRATLAEWLAEAHARSPCATAEGRWFAERPETLWWCFREAWGSEPELLWVDLPAAEAAARRVDRVTETLGGVPPRAISADPESEHILTRAQAELARSAGRVADTLRTGLDGSSFRRV